jgi:hypothetical protein
MYSLIIFIISHFKLSLFISLNVIEIFYSKVIIILPFYFNIFIWKLINTFPILLPIFKFSNPIKSFDLSSLFESTIGYFANNYWSFSLESISCCSIFQTILLDVLEESIIPNFYCEQPTVHRSFLTPILDLRSIFQSASFSFTVLFPFIGDH